MARWYENIRLEDPEPGRADSGHLIGEVSHAAGNLVHRMYYWTSILEEQPEAGESDEAVRELRDTLGGLHRLVKRTMDLLRPVKLRLISVAGADLVRSIAMRLGVELNDEDLEAHSDGLAQDVALDPVQLDRAVGLVADALGRHGDLASRTRHEITIADQGGQGGTVVTLESSGNFIEGCATNGTPDDGVHAEVGLALARKIFLALGWQVDLSQQGNTHTLTVVIPLTDGAAATGRTKEVSIARDSGGPRPS